VFQFKNALGPDGFLDGGHDARLIIWMNVFIKPGLAWRYTSAHN
jgi:hypothetical protein